MKLKKKNKTLEKTVNTNRDKEIMDFILPRIEKVFFGR